MHATDSPAQLAIVCDTIPFPARSGDNQRIAELIAVLRQTGWFVHLILCKFLDRYQRKECSAHVDALHTYTGAGWNLRLRNGLRHVVRFTDRAGARLGLPPAEDIATRILGRSLTPAVLNYWQRYPSGLDAFIAQLADRFPLKALIVEYIWLYPAAVKLNRRIPRLLDTHDIQHKRVEEFASRGLAFPLRISREREADIFKDFDSVIAIQSEEAALIKSMCPDLKVLTTGSSGSYGRSSADEPVTGRVFYIGGYNGANNDGLGRFLKSIWPMIYAESPNAHLHVCGNVYRAFAGERFERVKFLKHMEDPEREYREASVVINPSWIGTGLKIKSIEALARGKPLVTTAKGVEGLPDDVSRAALVCNGDKEFGAQVARLLRDPETRNEVCKKTRAFAEEYLQPQVVYKDLLDFLNELR